VPPDDIDHKPVDGQFKAITGLRVPFFQGGMEGLLVKNSDSVKSSLWFLGRGGNPGFALLDFRHTTH
jgi:hypothetical protein